MRSNESHVTRPCYPHFHLTNPSVKSPFFDLKTFIFCFVTFLISRYLLIFVMATNSTSSQSTLQDELNAIREQLASLTAMIPVVAEIKEAYDLYNERDETLSQASDTGLTQAPSLTSPDLTPNASATVAPPTPTATQTPILPPATPGPSNGHAPSVTPATQTAANPSIPSVATLAPALPAVIPGPSGISTLQALTDSGAGNRVSINQVVADSVTKALTHGLEEGTIQDLERHTMVPANCPRMQVVSCNPEIFRHATPDARKFDKDMQGVQKTLLRGLSALTQAISSLAEARPDGNYEMLANGIALCSHASHQLDISRRHLFQSSIKDEFKGLCTQEYPVTDLLFNTDLGDRVKAMGDTMKVSKSLSRASESHAPNKRGFPFLGQRSVKRPRWDEPKQVTSKQDPQRQTHQAWRSNNNKSRKPQQAQK